MATFKSNKVNETGQSQGLARGGDVVAKSLHEGVNVVSASYSISATVSAGDVIQMVNVPDGAQVVGVVLTCDDLDAGSSLVLDVGDGLDTDRYIDGSTIGQAGGVLVGPNNRAGVNYVYTAADTVDVLIQAFDGTGTATGTIKLDVHFLTESE